MFNDVIPVWNSFQYLHAEATTFGLRWLDTALVFEHGERCECQLCPRKAKLRRAAALQIFGLRWLDTAFPFDYTDGHEVSRVSRKP